MAAETQYTANNGMQNISTANTNLNGTGDISDAIITGDSNGTLVEFITVHATGTTTEGMVRIFIYDGTNTRLAFEVAIPAITPTGTVPAFGIRIPVSFALEDTWSLKASTEKGESFNVIAEGLDWTYYAASVRPESIKYTAQTGLAQVSTGTTARDGSDTTSVITGGTLGTLIPSLTIKATGNTTEGMIRLFLDDTSNTRLIMEIPVEATIASSSAHSFSKTITFEGKGLILKNGWSLKVSTNNSEAFNIIAEGLDWSYPA